MKETRAYSELVVSDDGLTLVLTEKVGTTYPAGAILKIVGVTDGKKTIAESLFGKVSREELLFTFVPVRGRS